MEQIRSLTSLVDHAVKVGPVPISVAGADDLDVLEAVEEARKKGIVKGYLVGNADKIKSEGAKIAGFDASNYEIIDERGGEGPACLKAVELVSSGTTKILMKGMVQTSSYMRAILNKEKGLRTGSNLSQVYIHEVEGYDRLFFITDPAINMYPDLKGKVAIVNNVLKLTRAFGIERPKIACIAAVEVVNPDMPPTLDAAALAQMSRRGQIKGCIIDGPFALDNAVSEESAKHKGVVSEVAGKADVLLVPNIEAGNMLAKSIVYFARNKTAAVVLGAKVPCTLTSRADSPETKLLSIASAVALAAHESR